MKTEMGKYGTPGQRKPPTGSVGATQQLSAVLTGLLHESGNRSVLCGPTRQTRIVNYKWDAQAEPFLLQIQKNLNGAIWQL